MQYLHYLRYSSYTKNPTYIMLHSLLYNTYTAVTKNIYMLLRWLGSTYTAYIKVLLTLPTSHVIHNII